MKNPNSVNLADDTHWRSLGWPAVARDSEGHAITTCDNSHEATFKDWLFECFNDGLTVTNLTKRER